MSGRILIVEDEPAIGRAVGYALEKQAFDVEHVGDGESGLEAARQGFDLVILDLMLPKMSGTDVLQKLRATSAIPILVLTARDSELDCVLGLELGADDYVTKPFSMAELVSRVRALLRRRELDRLDGQGTVREVGLVRLDLASHQVFVDERPVYLTTSQFRLLALLAETPGHVVSRRDILQRLWDSDYIGDEHVCDVHISNLRQKIERNPSRPQRIVTVRGAGYKLVAG